MQMKLSRLTHKCILVFYGKCTLYLKSARTTTGKVASDVRVTRRVQVKSC